MKSKILLINGSPNGVNGQSHQITNSIIDHLSKDIDFELLTLCDNTDEKSWKTKFAWAQGIIFLSGTYWDSWGSPLQVFLEKTTTWETGDLLLGKPAGVIITMHSVGGKSILSRLQGVLNTQGLIIPPLCGLVYSLNTHLIQKLESSHQDDFWHLSEIPIIVKNIATQIEMNQKFNPNWNKWDVDQKDVSRKWLSKDDITL